jgi:hypothetical protein
MNEEQLSPDAAVDAAIKRLAVANLGVADWYQGFVLPRTATKSDTDSGASIRAILMRICAWLSTTGKFTLHDFQAAAASARACLELLVDVATLIARPDRVAEMLDWERSAKLKDLERLQHMKFDITLDQQRFIDVEGPKIKALRLARWPVRHTPGKSRTPDRWDDRDLVAAVVDNREALGPAMMERFRTYSMMNWMLHGSGLVCFRGIAASTIDMATVLFISTPLHAGLRAGQLALAHLGVRDTTGLAPALMMRMNDAVDVASAAIDRLVEIERGARPAEPANTGEGGA